MVSGLRRPREATDVAVLKALASLGSRLPRTVTRGRQPASRVLRLRFGPLGDCRGRPCGKPLRASRKAGPLSTAAKCDVRELLRCRREPQTTSGRNHVHLSGRERRPEAIQTSRARAEDLGSRGGNPDTVRVETGAVAQHRAGDVEQAVGHRAQGARVSVTAGAQRLILGVADRITLGGDAGRSPGRSAPAAADSAGRSVAPPPAPVRPVGRLLRPPGKSDHGSDRAALG